MTARSRARRLAWLAGRRLRGQRRPLPFAIVPGNLMGVSTGPRHSARILRAYLDLGADAYLFTEAADLRIAEHADLGRWVVLQLGYLGSAQSAVAIVLRRDRLTTTDGRGDPITRVVGLDLVDGTPAGNGLRSRPILRARVVIDPGTVHERWHALNAGHTPPPRNPRMARRFLDRFADLWGTSGGDLNSTARGMTRYLRGRQLRIVRPVALVVPAWIPATRRVVILRRRLANADHHALWVWEWPTRREWRLAREGRTR